ncbi:MAG: hypothetical protein ACK5MQ_11390 [Pikeienuella sp.]
MIYRLIGERAAHLQARLTPLSPEAAQDAMLANTAYRSGFQAGEFNRDDFHFMDMIESYGPPVFSARFRDFCARHDVAAVFSPVDVFWGRENILEWLGDASEGFFTAVPPLVDVIDDGVTPMKFWPALRKFRREDFVITGELPENQPLAVDLKRPHLMLCSPGFRRLAGAEGLLLDFEDLPCAPVG